MVLGEVGAGGTGDEVQAPDFAAPVWCDGYSVLLGYLYYPHAFGDAAAPGDVGLPQVHRAGAGDCVEAVMRELVLAACYKGGLHIFYERGLPVEVVGGEDIFEPVKVVVRETPCHFQRNFGVPGHVYVHHDERVFAEDFAYMRRGLHRRVVVGIAAGPAMAELVGGVAEIAV